MINKLWEDFKDGLAQHGATRLAVYTLHRRIPDEMTQFVIDNDDAFRRIFDNQLEKQPLAAQPLLHLVTFGGVPRCGHDMVIVAQLLEHTYEHHIDRPGYPCHRPLCRIALIFARANTSPHQAQRQLRLLWTEDFFNGAAGHLLVAKVIGALSRTVEIYVYKASIGGSAK